MPRQEIDYTLALKRIERFSIVLATAGSVVTGVIAGPANALGFAVGSLLALLSFLLIKRTVNSLGPGTAPPTNKSTAMGLVFRYLVIGATVFGIIKFTGISAWPVFAGLMTTVVAVLAEIVYELATA